MNGRYPGHDKVASPFVKMERAKGKKKLIKYRESLVKYFLDNFVDIIVYLLSAVKRIEKLRRR